MAFTGSVPLINADVPEDDLVDVVAQVMEALSQKPALMDFFLVGVIANEDLLKTRFFHKVFSVEQAEHFWKILGCCPCTFSAFMKRGDLEQIAKPYAEKLLDMAQDDLMVLAPWMFLVMAEHPVIGPYLKMRPDFHVLSGKQKRCWAFYDTRLGKKTLADTVKEFGSEGHALADVISKGLSGAFAAGNEERWKTGATPDIRFEKARAVGIAMKENAAAQWSPLYVPG